MIMAMVQDIRVILIKLAAVRTTCELLTSSPRQTSPHRSRDPRNLRAPCTRLGIHDIKVELEILGFGAYPWRARLPESEVKRARGNRKARTGENPRRNTGTIGASGHSVACIGSRKAPLQHLSQDADERVTLQRSDGHFLRFVLWLIRWTPAIEC